MPAQALDFMYSIQASAEHFKQCAEFLLLRNRGLGPIAATALPIPLARRGAAAAKATEAAAPPRGHRSCRDGDGARRGESG